jgi:CRP/FNR family transcriptional regulator
MLTNGRSNVTNNSRSLAASLQRASPSHLTSTSHREVGIREWPRCKTRNIAAKGHLFIEGNSRTHIYKIVSGSVCLYRMLEDRRRQVINFSFDQDIVGLGSGPFSACNAQALTETRVKCLPITAILTAAKADPRVALGLYEALSRELLAAHEHLLSVGQRGASERLTTFLVMLSRRNEMRGRSGATIDLPMSRADIADFLGITIETVSRTLTKFRQQRLIEIDQITTLHLKSMSRLVAIAEGGARV